jgi:putative CocE/NonD family hydrolase
VHQASLPVVTPDGTRLSSTIIHPTAENASKTSVILIKTPYSPQSEWTTDFRKDLFSRLVRKGYTLVLVNYRGTRLSEGEYHWLQGIKNDDYDTLSWIAAQPWSNGRVGTFGCSSSAEGQIPLMTLNHPAHKAAVPMGAATGVGEIPEYDDQGIWYIGGVPLLAWSWWFEWFGYHAQPVIPAGISQDQRARLVRTFPIDMRRPLTPNIEQHLPSADILKAAGTPSTDFDALMRLAPADDYWKTYDFLRTGESTKVPTLHVDSWYDSIEIYPTAKMYEYLSRNSPNQYLVIGPTKHCAQGSETAHTKIGEYDVGDARFDYTSLIVSFFDHFVDDDGKGPFETPKVQFYTMGTSHWTHTGEWPVPSKAYRLFLHSHGAANSIWGDGVLDRNAPSATEPADSYVSDPLNPVPCKSVSFCSSQPSIDQRDIEVRHDVLVYSSSALERTFTFVGYIKAKLFLSSDARDTDIMLKFVDVYPDGRPLSLLDTAQRVRYRNGSHDVELMKVGRVYEVNLRQMVTAVRIPAGHRIRIEIASSNFPPYERNLNTGGHNFDETNARTAKIWILHDAAHPSSLQLPLIE